MRNAIILLAVVALASIASALSVSYGASSVALCPCDTAVLPVFSDGEASTTTLVPYSAGAVSTSITSRNPAGSLNARLLVAAKCDAAPGDYPVMVVADDGASQASAIGVARVETCSGLTLSLSRTAKSCGSIDYVLEAVNHGKKTEYAHFATDLNPSSYRISQKQFIMSPGSRTVFQLTVYPPATAPEGETRFNAGLVAESQASASVSLGLQLPLCTYEDYAPSPATPVPTFVPPASTARSAGFFNLPSFTAPGFPKLDANGIASGATGFITAGRLPLTAAIIVVLLLLAIAVLYMRGKYAQSSEESAKDAQRRKRAKEMADFSARHPSTSSERAARLKVLVDE